MSTNPEARGGAAVLVVDDEPLLRMDTADMLHKAGFEVQEAGSADEALQKLNGGGFRLDALVTDVQMPGATNGYGLARRVHELFPEAAIVIISGVVSPSPGQMPPNATFLSKPVDPDRLLRAIRGAMADRE